MKIECPKCQFSRELADDTIPETAQMATCPKCEEKFIFRELPTTVGASENEETVESLENELDGENIINEKDKTDEKQKVAKKSKDFPWDSLYELEKKAKKYLEGKIPDNTLLGTKAEKKKKNSVVFRENIDENFEPAAKAPKILVPFEDRARFNIVVGFFETAKRILFSPRLFFSTMFGNNIAYPLAFAAISLFITFTSNMLISFFLVNIGSLQLPEVYQVMMDDIIKSGISLWSLFGSVLLLLVLMVLCIVTMLSACLLVSLRGVLKQEYTFISVYRVVLYSSVSAFLLIVPFIGPVVAGLGFMYLLVEGFKSHFNIDYAQAGFSCLLVVLAFIFMGIVFTA